MTATEIQTLLDTLPDETLIEASGTYTADNGSFRECWARPVPRDITGADDDGPRIWEVLVYGDSWPQTLTTADRITSVRVLYTSKAAVR